jgi:hypothetical protein
VVGKPNANTPCNSAPIGSYSLRISDYRGKTIMIARRSVSALVLAPAPGDMIAHR